VPPLDLSVKSMLTHNLTTHPVSAWLMLSVWVLPVICKAATSFFTFDTMEKITRPPFVLLPMTKAVIQCVHKIAQMEGRPNLLDLKFTAGNGEH
jgi:hypothetical protein